VRASVWVCSGRWVCGCFEVIQHDAAYVMESGSDGGAKGSEVKCCHVQAVSSLVVLTCVQPPLFVARIAGLHTSRTRL